MFAPYNQAFQLTTQPLVSATHAPTQMPSQMPPPPAPRRARRQPPALSEHGFPPESWGPSLWLLMHVVAATYPVDPTPEARRQFAAFYASLQHVIPCGGCRRGYAALINGSHRLTPDVLADRMSLFRWTVDVHNAVNAKVGKPVNSDYIAWYKRYDSLRAG